MVNVSTRVENTNHEYDCILDLTRLQNLTYAAKSSCISRCNVYVKLYGYMVILLWFSSSDGLFGLSVITCGAGTDKLMKWPDDFIYYLINIVILTPSAKNPSCEDICHFGRSKFCKNKTYINTLLFCRSETENEKK